MRGLRDPRHPATFSVLVLVSFIVARFLGVGVHEILGHGLSAAALGGTFYGVYLSPVSGFAFVYLPVSLDPAAKAFIALAGILAEIVTGALVFLLLPRMRSFVPRLFGLMLLQVLFVHPLLYLAVGGFGYPVAGDPAEAIAWLGAPHLRFAFPAVAIPWLFGAAYLVSNGVASLAAPDVPPRRQLVSLLLFWLYPLAFASIPSTLETGPLSPASLGVILALLLVLVGIPAFFTLRSSRPVPVPSGPRAPTIALLVALFLVVPTWAGGFGFTRNSAENWLFEEPPLEAERVWASPLAINVRVHVEAGFNVTLEFRFKGVREPTSPLQQRAIASYEERADLPYWSSLAVVDAVSMMNGTQWNVTSARIDSSGFVWFGGAAWSNPRLIELGLAIPGNRSAFLTVTPGTPTVVELRVLDPFLSGGIACEGCFLDEVNLTWDPSLNLGNASWDGGSPEVLLGSGGGGTMFIRFRNAGVADAPTAYALVLNRP